MATNDPVGDLHAFKRLLVQERRRIVSTALDLREQNGEGGL